MIRNKKKTTQTQPPPELKKLEPFHMFEYTRQFQRADWQRSTGLCLEISTVATHMTNRT